MVPGRVQIHTGHEESLEIVEEGMMGLEAMMDDGWQDRSMDSKHKASSSFDDCSKCLLW